MKNKGQSAFEYILVVGIALMILVPGAMLLQKYSYKSSDEVIRSKINMIGNDLIDSTEKIYYIGENSWETLKLDLPNNVIEYYILNNYELVIVYNTYTGSNEAVFFSDIEIRTPFYDGSKGYVNADVHSGLNIIKVTSYGSYVFINETK